MRTIEEGEQGGLYHYPAKTDVHVCRGYKEKFWFGEHQSN